MKKFAATSPDIPEALIAKVMARLEANKRIRRSLPVWGRIAIDRQLPFLCVYRRPSGHRDAGTERLVTGGAAYLLALADTSKKPRLPFMVTPLAQFLSDHFGAFLIIELWTGQAPDLKPPFNTADLFPEFRLYVRDKIVPPDLVDALEQSLTKIHLGKNRAQVEVRKSRKVQPRDMAPLLLKDSPCLDHCFSIGLEVSPVFRDPESGEVFPVVLRQLSRRVSVALRNATFHFARHHTRARPRHMHVLGPKAVVKAVLKSDRILSEVSEQMDFLLGVTPVNGEQAWYSFRRTAFDKAPGLHYRPLLTDAIVLKRRIYAAPVEHIEDPVLALIFREKLNELERQISMLQDRNSARFLHGSIQLYGCISDDLKQLARRILQEIPTRSRDEGGAKLSAEQFAQRARQEVAALQDRWPDMDTQVMVRKDVTGLMVSRGNLLVSAASRIPLSRVEALIQHEVGTHALTHANGKAQRLRTLTSGLAGYEALQEGLAVLAEYLVGGLSRSRLRLLAGRVEAACALERGADFVETFRLLNRKYGFSQRGAFAITVRTHRAGGFTKDAIYLKGLKKILAYLENDGVLEDLFVGKIGLAQLGVIRELRWRKVLREPPLLPRYLERIDCRKRLDALRGNMTMLDLIPRRKKR